MRVKVEMMSGSSVAAPGRPVANREVPARAPLRRMGEIPVVARIVWAGGAEQWCVAVAVRWTDTHVMVTWVDDLTAPRTERYEWLAARDVVRAGTWPAHCLELDATTWTVGRLRAELVGLPDDQPVSVAVADDSGRSRIH